MSMKQLIKKFLANHSAQSNRDHFSLHEQVQSKKKERKSKPIYIIAHQVKIPHKKKEIKTIDLSQPTDLIS